MKESDTKSVMHMLFTAKWNIPQAAEALGMVATESEWEKLKTIFAEYCKQHQVTWISSN